jgi:hypothetical protein
MVCACTLNACMYMHYCTASVTSGSSSSSNFAPQATDRNKHTHTHMHAQAFTRASLQTASCASIHAFKHTPKGYLSQVTQDAGMATGRRLVLGEGSTHRRGPTRSAGCTRPQAPCPSPRGDSTPRLALCPCLPAWEAALSTGHCLCVCVRYVSVIMYACMLVRLCSCENSSAAARARDE